MSARKRLWFSLSGVLTIVHLSLWVAMFFANSTLADAGGVIVVDDSNGMMVHALDWFAFLLACPFYALIAPRGFEFLPMDIVGMVANSLLVGYGLAGGCRLISGRQIGLRSLFAITTLVALCLFGLSFRNDNRIFVFLIAAAISLVLLSFVRPRDDVTQ